MHLTAAGRPSQFMQMASQLGLCGIPFLDEWNQKILDLFRRFCSEFYKDFPHFGREVWELADVEVESDVEKEAILRAFSSLYRFYNELQWKKAEAERHRR